MNRSTRRSDSWNDRRNDRRGWRTGAVARSIALAAFVVSTAPSCSKGPTAASHHPVVVIGIDGMEWRVARPLLEAGELPNLQRLIDRGASGYLYTRRPAKSPVIWTTVATGKRPQHHGVMDFLDPKRVPYTSESRRGKALWNIASDYGLDTLTVGWWVTWPAEEVRGEMIAPYSAAGQDAVNWKGNFYEGLAGQTWPAGLIDEVLPIATAINDPAELARLRKIYFGDARADALFGDLPEDVRDARRAEVKTLIEQLMWSVAADETYLRVAKDRLAKAERFPDLTMLYFGGPDVASHRFWRYMDPDAFSYEVEADAVAMLGDVVRTFYRRADWMIGEVLALVPADADVIVCSDHGFHADFTDQRHPQGVSAHHLDGPAGVIVAAGPDIQVGMGANKISGGQRLLDMGFVDDVSPLVLSLLGIPVGRDFEDPSGGPLRTIVRADLPRLEPIVTHDEGFRLPTAPRSAGKEFENAATEWMVQLGYVSGDGGGDDRVGPDGSSGSGSGSGKDATDKDG